MMISLQSYVQQGKSKLRQLALNPEIHLSIRAAAYFLAGFVLSAASLYNHFLPLAMGLTCACTGWSAALVAAGGSLGYFVFWGSAGQQGVVWVLAGLLIALLFGERRISAQLPLLFTALAGLVVSATGVIFQSWFSDTTPVGVYLIRVGFGAASAWLFRQVLRGRNPILDWMACCFGVLSLAQIAPFPWLSFGVVAAGALAVSGAFPAAALAGLALDLAGLSPVSMTAAMCGSYLVRFLPRYPRWMGAAAPVCTYLLVAAVSGALDIMPLPALLLGGIIGVFLPFPSGLPSRRGETVVAQVRLEMASLLAGCDGSRPFLHLSLYPIFPDFARG